MTYHAVRRSHLFCVIAGLASFAPKAKCTASHTLHFHVTFRFSVFRFWCNILHINDCAVFVVILKCRFAFSLFLFQISGIGHLTNSVRIWSLLVRLTKCAAHLGKRAAQLAKLARNLPNVAHLVKCRAFDQLVKALRICPNAQIGQMRLIML